MVFFLAGCDPGSSGSSSSSSSSSSGGPFLYVSSGLCYSGNNTTFTATTSSNQVYRLDLSTAARTLIADYNAAPSVTGDSPTGIVNIDSDYMYILVENGTAANRRIERVAKSERGSRSTFYQNATTLSASLKNLFLDSGSNLIFSKTTAVELITPAGARPQTPFISASAAPCNTSTTIVSKVLPLSNGKVAFIHATANQNRIGIMPVSGGTTCQVAQAAPVLASSFPSAMFYDSANNKLIVAYSGNATTADFNSIYAYTINESTPTISGAQKLYDANGYPGTYSHLLYGISDMYYDEPRGHVYIATAISTATTVVNYNIEKFTYNPANIGVDNANVLVRVGSTPFYSYGSDTKCIAQMFVAD